MSTASLRAAAHYGMTGCWRFGLKASGSGGERDMAPGRRRAELVPPLRRWRRRVERVPPYGAGAGRLGGADGGGGGDGRGAAGGDKLGAGARVLSGVL